MASELIPTSKLELNRGQLYGLPKNPRFIKDKRFEDLKKSLQDDPEMMNLRECIVYPLDNNNFIIVGGNMRFRACQELGWQEIPCRIIPKETPVAKLRAITIKDNAAFGENDLDALVTDWDMDELKDFGLDESLFDSEEDDKEIVEDEIPEEVETRCKKGDIWRLGNHRLMCGDSTDSASVAILMRGERADIAFTSPPYGVDLNYNDYHDSFENTKSLVEKVLPIMADNTDDYIVLNWGDIVSAKNINKTNQPSMFSWLPVYLDILSRKDWHLWAERIWKKPHARCSGIWSASSNRPVSDWEYIFTFASHQPKYNERANGSHFGIIDSSEDGQSDTLSKHPGAFPVFIPSKVIQTHCAEGASVFDPFGGTGTTLIAAEQLNRKCFMMEIDPHYCDITITRWEQFTGLSAEKVAE